MITLIAVLSIIAFSLFICVVYIKYDTYVLNQENDALAELKTSLSVLLSDYENLLDDKDFILIVPSIVTCRVGANVYIELFQGVRDTLRRVYEGKEKLPEEFICNPCDNDLERAKNDFFYKGLKVASFEAGRPWVADKIS